MHGCSADCRHWSYDGSTCELSSVVDPMLMSCMMIPVVGKSMPDFTCIYSMTHGCARRGMCIYFDVADRDLSSTGGAEDWTVFCICGTRDDDGERMFDCDNCGVWVHPRCHNIPDHSEVPERFLCFKCQGLLEHK